jgi:Holliday junction resolvase-like predicted endonuclease
MTAPKTKASATNPVTSEVTTKKTPKPRAKKVVLEVSPQERYKMIQNAAYFIAKNNNFEDDPFTYWIEAESQIDKAIA